MEQGDGLKFRVPPSAFRVRPQCPRQESNLAYDRRRVACLHHTPRTISIPTWTRTRAQTFGGSDASATPSGQNERGSGTAERGTVRHSAFPLPRSAFERAGGGIRTHINRITGAVPFCVEPRRRSAGAQGFEPCAAVLEAAYSPRSTLLQVRSGECGVRSERQCLLHSPLPTPHSTFLKHVSGGS